MGVCGKIQRGLNLVGNERLLKGLKQRNAMFRFSFWRTFFGFVEDGFEGPEESGGQGECRGGNAGKMRDGRSFGPQGAYRESLVTDPDVSAGLVPGWLSFTF